MPINCDVLQWYGKYISETWNFEETSKLFEFLEM